MIDKVLAVKQIVRLNGMRGYPRAGDSADADQTKQAKALMADMVIAMRCAKDEAEAKAVIDGFVYAVGTGQYCPLPADIRRAVFARQSAQEGEYEVEPTKCSMCGDSGFRSITRNGYSFAVRCDHKARAIAEEVKA